MPDRIHERDLQLEASKLDYIKERIRMCTLVRSIGRGVTVAVLADLHRRTRDGRDSTPA